MKNCLVLFIFLTSSFFSVSQNTRAVVTTDVNVRWEPSTGSKKIKTFAKGKEVLILKTKGNWSFIQDPNNDKKGWVYSKFLKTDIRYVIKNANVRNKPGGSILKQISQGKKVIILQEKGSWCFIKDISNKKKGWVHQSLLSFSNNKSSTISSSSSKSSSSVASSSSNKASVSVDEKSSIRIIEDRLGSSWRDFYQNMPQRVIVNDISTFYNTINSYIGVPYEKGGTSKSGVDCSGLIYCGLKSAGYSGSRLNAGGFAKIGRFIAQKTSLRKGDLVFFTNSYPTSKFVTHVGVYAGNNEFIHAPSPRKTVEKIDINTNFWKDKFIFGVRLTND